MVSARIVLASPRGFCAGVDRAIEIVERALDRFGAPVYVRHEIVHNQHVVDDLRAKGAIFVEEPSSAPPGSHLIYSAHGVSPAVRQEAQEQGLVDIDATCPLVTKVHNEVKRMVAEGYEIVMIGHAGHVEVEGTVGQAPDQMVLVETVEDVEQLTISGSSRLGCVTQTTLSVDDTREIMEALRRRFPHIRLPKRNDICYATQNRQDAVKALAACTELVLVVGAPNSSNSNRLVEVAAKRGARSHLIQDADDIQAAWLKGTTQVGVTAGASSPEFLVQQVIQRLEELLGDCEITSQGDAEEGVTFKMPAELRSD
jgi:4-hydroxy-3-methylbut-2-enyl diphosphate reductase